MSLPHLLMLGLIDGASVGVVEAPPATIGELEQFTIDQFYCVDHSGGYRPLTMAQFRFLRGVMKIRAREKLRAHRDRAYYDRLEQEARRALILGSSKHGKRAA